jgi:hypothetical protein
MTSFEQILIAVVGYLTVSIALGSLVGRYLRGPINQPEVAATISPSVDGLLPEPELLVEA